MSPQKLYEQMLFIRCVEDRLFQACKDGRAGDLHFNKGQEAIAVGVCAALQPTDHMVTHHRTIAHAIAKSGAIGNNTYKSKHTYRMLAELFGKVTGVNGGRAGEMHISNPIIRHDFAFQLVGTCLPVSAGIAWAQKYFHKNREIVAVFVGDAASSNGTFHEACTIAAIQKVPLLIVCENNGRAGNITQEHYIPKPLECIAERMPSYGIPAWTINGQDVDFVRQEAKAAVDLVRGSGCPVFLEIKVERLSAHKIGQGDARTAEEMRVAAEKDPLLVTGEILGVKPHERQELEERFCREIDAMIARIEQDPLPTLELA